MNADRNLLVGILALQMDFINRDTLVNAMNSWVLAKSKPLAEILQDRHFLSPERRQLLDALVEEHVKQCGGDTEKSLASVPSLASVRADLEQIADCELQASLAGIRVQESLPPAEGLPATLPLAREQPTGTRFTVLRPHAKGGLGKVSVARDEELNREVAFKEIQERFADDPVNRARFLLEAEITGGLEHPGIVPVYGLGQYEDGKPFYAMRFIRGQSLHEAIKQFHKADGRKQDPGERSVEFRKLLARFIDVCNAIEYAHSRRVLHRDLKPGNIMLGKYGETLVVDWGLAKTLSGRDAPREDGECTLRPKAASDSGQTQMGSAVGTPQYMSPEQAQGRLDELGPPTDVYGLGATLYCLLTGRAPFSDSDSNKTVELVAKGEFPHPRSIKPDTPRALEAICLQAMALRPSDRYSSARALANDIEHWLADEPVSALSESAALRCLRWLRRHRAWTRAAAAAVIVAMIGVAGVIWQWRHAVQAEAVALKLADDAEQARGGEMRQKENAEASLRESNQRLAEVYRQRGLTAASDNHYAEALLHWADAIVAREVPVGDVRAETDVADRMRMALCSLHLARLRNVMEGCKNLPPRATISPDGEKILPFAPLPIFGWNWRSGFGSGIWTTAGGGQIAGQDWVRNGWSSLFIPNQSPWVIWNLMSGEAQPFQLSAETGSGQWMARYSPRGKWIVLARQGNTRLFDAETLKPAVVPMPIQNDTGPGKVQLYKFVGETPALAEGEFDVVFSNDDGWISIRPIRGGDAWTIWTPNADQSVDAGRSRAMFAADIDDTFWALGTADSEKSGFELTVARLRPRLTDGGIKIERDTPIVLQQPQAKAFSKHSEQDHRLRDFDFIVSAGPRHLAVRRFDQTVSVWELPSGKLVYDRVKPWAAGGVLLEGAWLSSDAVELIGARLEPDRSGASKIEICNLNDERAEASPFGSLTAPLQFATPDGQSLIAGAGELGVYVWEAAPGYPRGPALRHAGPVSKVAFASVGATVVTASWDNTARMWTVDSGTAQADPMRHTGLVVDVAISRDGKLIATASWDRTARLWHAETGKPASPPLVHEGAVQSVRFSPDGRRLLTAADDGMAIVWDTNTFLVIERLNHVSPVVRAEFDRSGERIATAGTNGAVNIWQEGKARTLPAGAGSIEIAFSPNEDVLVTAASNGAVRLWDSTSCEAIGGEMRHAGPIKAVAFRPDGAQIATASLDKTARLWNAQTGEPLGRTLEHDGAVRHVAYSADGLWLVTASDDGAARLWEAATGEPLGEPFWHSPPGQPAAVLHAVFGETGEFLATACDDGAARVWRLPRPMSMSGDDLFKSTQRRTCGKLAGNREFIPVPRTSKGPSDSAVDAFSVEALFGAEAPRAFRRWGQAAVRIGDWEAAVANAALASRAAPDDQTARRLLLEARTGYVWGIRRPTEQVICLNRRFGREPARRASGACPCGHPATLGNWRHLLLPCRAFTIAAGRRTRQPAAATKIATTHCRAHVSAWRSGRRHLGRQFAGGSGTGHFAALVGICRRTRVREIQCRTGHAVCRTDGGSLRRDRSVFGLVTRADQGSEEGR